jgi:hypothetical protein
MKPQRHANRKLCHPQSNRTKTSSDARRFPPRGNLPKLCEIDATFFPITGTTECRQMSAKKWLRRLRVQAVEARTPIGEN